MEKLFEKIKVSKVIYSSTSEVYSDGFKMNLIKIPTDEMVPIIFTQPTDTRYSYGTSKFMCEFLVKEFGKKFKLDTLIIRYHNIYGPFGTYDGGREKAPAALCRKIISAKKNNLSQIDVWGDGKQTRTFLYVDECVEGTLRLFESNYSDPVNIGSDEQVSINQMIGIIFHAHHLKKLTKK